MGPVTVSILQKETGARIRHLMEQHGYTVQDIQRAMGFQSPQAIYKWLSGATLPSIDNLVILSRFMNTTVDDILVLDSGGVVFSARPVSKALKEHQQKDLLKDSRRDMEEKENEQKEETGEIEEIEETEAIEEIERIERNEGIEEIEGIERNEGIQRIQETEETKGIKERKEIKEILKDSEAETWPGYRFRSQIDCAHTEYRLREYYTRLIDIWDEMYAS